MNEPVEPDAPATSERSAVPWRAFFEHSLDAALLTAPDGRILAANPAACRLLGRTERDLCQDGRAGVVVRDELLGPLLEQRRRCGAARGELHLRRADGTVFRAEVSSAVFRFPGGEEVTSMSIADLTERQRATRQLEALAEAGRVLNESLDIGETLQRLTALLVPALADVCIVDLLEAGEVRRVAVAHRDAARVEAVRRVRRMTMRQPGAGVDRVLRTGQPELVSVVTDDYLRAAAHDAEHFAAAQALGITSLVIVPLGAHGRILGALTLASTGGVASYDEAAMRLAQALGDRAAAALDNAHQHEAALAATRLRDEVLSVVSHDLGSAISAIRLCAKALALRGPVPEVDAIERAARHAAHLIRDLLLAAEMDVAPVPLARQREDVRAICDEVTALHGPGAAAKSIELAVRVDKGLPSVEVDRHRMVQMLDNLVGNAIKFTERGRVELRARVDAGMLVIEVADSGVGIGPDELPHVFDRFWQSARARRAGAGLGLAIARGVAVGHGGDITVRSTLGRGTTFVVTLPLTRT
ncbi:MAG: PAS domain-containing sensor histidine kinase [Myxococcales bacterium]|nr:PAS domain-containing sensor histidine kinase [Myxococcales bacterium]